MDYGEWNFLVHRPIHKKTAVKSLSVSVNRMVYKSVHSTNPCQKYTKPLHEKYCDTWQHFAILGIGNTLQLTVQSETSESWLPGRSEEHTSELQSHVRISYAVFCLKKKIQSYVIYFWSEFTFSFHSLYPATHTGQLTYQLLYSFSLSFS